MALQAAQSVTAGGLSVALTAANNADTAKVRTGNKLVVFNGSGGSINVTLTVQTNAENGTPIADTVKAVAAGAFAVIPLEFGGYRNASGEVEIEYSATADVTRGVIAG